MIVGSCGENGQLGCGLRYVNEFMIVDPCTLEEILLKIKKADLKKFETTDIYPGNGSTMLIAKFGHLQR